MLTLHTDSHTGNTQLALDGQPLTVPVNCSIPPGYIVLSGHSAHRSIRQLLKDRGVIEKEVLGGLPSSTIPLEIYALTPGYVEWAYHVTSVQA